MSVNLSGRAGGESLAEEHEKGREMRLAPALAGVVAVGLLAAGCKSAPAAMTPQENQQAIQFQQQQNWSGLAQLAQKAIGENSNDAYAWWDLGIADDGLGNKAGAVTAYEKALPLITPNAQNQTAQMMALNSIAQTLAADYVALGEGSKLAALIQQLQSSDPQEVASLKAQFSGALQYGTAPAAAGGALPDVSPQSLASLQTRVRGGWQRDAIAVRVTVDSMDGGGFQTVWDFYSPAARSGETVTVSPSTTTASGVANPSWGTAAIPGSFLSLAAAFGQVSSGPPTGLELATLSWPSGQTNDPLGLVWSIAAKTGGDAMLLPAYLMTPAQMLQLQSAAGSGNAASEYILGEVYASGIAGSQNAGLALQWVTKAANAGYALAENKLGQYEQIGFGTAANAAAAAQWYARAANAGDAAAEFNLGLMYESGSGVGQNWTTADQWISAAARQGLQPAVLELNFVHNTALRVQHAQQLAAQQQNRSPKCNWLDEPGAFGKCYPNPMITVMVTDPP